MVGVLVAEGRGVFVEIVACIAVACSVFGTVVAVVQANRNKGKMSQKSDFVILITYPYCN